ncbi:Bacterial cellulose synthase subunit [Rivularia sp. PCC 7116]|uniref:cellulose biosynthesis cyclic di-GMP-binding regulatory protein BcsB n=1 Tax=Rivularia sp. PCC 7116 TaxID=373994 RepID=UPI00029F26DF|nr:cellulose biosynthesis cyclic di-GMP-binding regulatory protein BcsB [Rivularia sp. PCC 7116]AFY57814.1 Bacterial cellulose synthase subunit [Rivularia sp. PCC 7116]
MKRLLYLSQASTQIFIIFCSLLMSPYSSLDAQAVAQESFIAQADTSDVDEDTDATSETATSGKTITHNLEFNRAPIVGNRMRLRGIYSEGRLGFTRPRGWNIGNVKASIRFQHSPALYANRSNLTVLVNDTAVGSVPLNRKNSQIGELLVNIPPKLLQDYNELKIVAQQNNSEICTNPNDPNLWTEILPDSKLVFNFQRKSVAENFSRYPYPIFDKLGLEASKINYLQPTNVDPTWLTAASRLQASLGRKADFRSLDADLVTDITKVKSNEKVVIIGTPQEQPALAEIDLPITVEGNKILNKEQTVVPDDRGVLIMTTTESGSPVLIATGNGKEGVEKAIKFLVQSDTSKMGSGQVVVVDKVPELPTPGERQWPRYLPEKNSFQLSEITAENEEKFKDVTVRGAGAPAVEIDFRALPDDRFLRGSSMNLVYSYGPQLNPRTSAVEVLLDGNFIGGERLSSESGETRKNLKVDLPPKLIKPNSKIEVFFRMNAREPFNNESCIYAPDQQLTGTLHNETSFDLKRETSATLPNLELLQFGFPFASPQDLSQTTIVVPKNPSKTNVLTLLEFSERLGRLSQAPSVKLDVYTPDTLSNDESAKNNHIVAIGTQNNFPISEALEKSQGLNLSQSFFRLFGNEQDKEQVKLQIPQDSQGMIKQIISPWNNDRVVLALTAQTESGLDRVRQVLDRDAWFFQLKQDTVLISSDEKEPNAYDDNAFELSFFNNAPKTRRLDNSNALSKTSQMFQENWLFIPVGIVGLALILYGIVQLYLKRLNVKDKT